MQQLYSNTLVHRYSSVYMLCMLLLQVQLETVRYSTIITHVLE